MKIQCDRAVESEPKMTSDPSSKLGVSFLFYICIKFSWVIYSRYMDNKKMQEYATKPSAIISEISPFEAYVVVLDRE